MDEQSGALFALLPVPWLYTEDWLCIEDQLPGAYPIPGGNKYRNLALQVWGVSRIERINYGLESRGTQIGERLRWRCPAKN
jgi:hypothetical protein